MVSSRGPARRPASRSAVSRCPNAIRANPRNWSPQRAGDHRGMIPPKLVAAIITRYAHECVHGRGAGELPDTNAQTLPHLRDTPASGRALPGLPDMSPSVASTQLREGVVGVRGVRQRRSCTHSWRVASY